MNEKLKEAGRLWIKEEQERILDVCSKQDISSCNLSLTFQLKMKLMFWKARFKKKSMK